MTLTAHLWQSTLCAATAACVVLMLRRAPARYRHAIWMLAAAKFLVPFGVLAAIGHRFLAWLAPAEVPLAAWINRSVPLLTLHADGPDGWTLSDSFHSMWPALGLIWIVGSAALLTWRLRQWRAAVAMVRRARPLTHGRESEAFARVTRKSRCVQTIDLRQEDSTLEPCVVGVFAPAIVWPRGLSEGLTDDELEGVLAHEVAHVTRYDNLMAWMQIAVETLFWFYPLTWWIGTQIVKERERACDEEVVRLGTGAPAYAAAILKVCNFCLRTQPTFAAGVGGSTTVRIERILTATPHPTRAGGARLTALCFGLVMIGAPLTLGALGVTSNGRQPKVYSPTQAGITAPKLVKEIKPVYTRDAMHARVQGIVKLEAVVLADGKVGDVTITQSLDKEFGMDDRVIAAVKKWEFQPGRKDGKAVPVRVQIDFSFTLK